MTRSEIGTIALTLAVGGAGAFAASWLGIPAPFLTGPAIAVTLLGLTGLRLFIPKVLAGLCFVVIGMSIGAGVTPEVLDTARQWPASFVMLGLSLVAIIAICGFCLRRFFGYDRASAILASSPGHLSYVLGLSSSVDVDVRTISLVQSIRVLAMTLLVPFAVATLGGDLDAAAFLPAAMPLAAIAGIFAVSYGIGRILDRFHVPAGLLLGGMLVTTATHMTGFVEGGVPNWLGLPAFLIMGCLIGSRFSGVTMAMISKAIWAGVTITLVASIVAAVFAVAVAAWFDLPLPQLLIAFTPGGVEVMIAMAVLLDADPTFVAAHHVMRLFILTFLVPVMLGRKRKPELP